MNRGNKNAYIYSWIVGMLVVLSYNSLSVGLISPNFSAAPRARFACSVDPFLSWFTSANFVIATRTRNSSPYNILYSHFITGNINSE